MARTLAIRAFTASRFLVLRQFGAVQHGLERFRKARPWSELLQTVSPGAEQPLHPRLQLAVDAAALRGQRRAREDVVAALPEAVLVQPHLVRQLRRRQRAGEVLWKKYIFSTSRIKYGTMDAPKTA